MIRAIEGSFKATTKAVDLFRRYRHQGKLTIRINTVVSRTNYQTLETLPYLAHNLGADRRRAFGPFPATMLGLIR
ncbi:MAG TPA: hypothetical protein VFY25_14900 [Anaerolineales bacterium]|nr:hypothetical protein [Anaerolineales bacterium]